MTRAVIFLLMLQLLLACKDNDENRSKNTDFGTLEYKVNFPDTVEVKKAYDGEIHFKSPLDTITEKFFEKEEDRYVVFRCPNTRKYNMDREFYDDSLSEYRFGAIDNRTIYFYGLSFHKPGTYRLKGLVNDLVLIELSEKDEEGEDLIRLIENDYPIDFKVVVVEQ